MSVFDNMKAASGTGTARGTFPIIKNSANGKMKNLKLFGASTQAANPTPDNPQEIESVVLNSIAAYGAQILDLEANTSSTTNGFNISVESGYIITANGTPNAVYSNLTDYAEISIPKGKYTFSIDKTPTELEITRVGIKFRKSIDDSTNITHLITGSNKSITIDYSGDYKLVQIYVEGCDTSKSYNFTIKTMLNEGEIALPFEAFNANIANLPETIEMNGIGELKDYIDYERGVFVQRFKEKHITKADMEKFTQATNGNYIATYPLNDEKLFGKCICTHFKGIHTDDRIILANMFRCYLEGDSRLYFRDIADNSLFSNATNSLAFFENNDVCVWYELAEPIETPLSPAALLELNKLRTFDSITCVSNDAGAEMEIEYFKNNATGQAMSDIHAGVPRFVLDGTTLHIIV